MKVLAAVSGGVDSAVAMARAVDAGHDVTAVHLALARDPRQRRMGTRGCCSIEDSLDARRAADTLGVPFYVWDLSEQFTEEVIDDFIAEYSAGRTPNPCLRCNERIKFAAVLDRALALGFDAVATGHYARIVAGPAGKQLHRAVDMAKDQSYVLAVVAFDDLQHCLFPLGDSTKPQVRAEAERRGLSVAAKPDSHDICFIPDGDTAGWLRRQVGATAGPIVDAASGDTVGQHRGTHTYTIGQRRGLALSEPAPDGRPRYVVGLEPGSNTVLIGPETLLRVSVIEAGPASWAVPVPPTQPFEARVQIRAHASDVAATVTPGPAGDTVRVDLVEPLRAVAPGQSVVVYQGTQVIGQATIGATRTASSA